MELSQKIRHAKDLTRRLLDALEAHDHGVWEELLERRAHAMADFSQAHQGASKQEMDMCQEEVRALVEADHSLQDRSRELLVLVTGELRGQLGHSAQGKHSMVNKTIQACVDRKA
jgi:hypothetical protein